MTTFNRSLIPLVIGFIALSVLFFGVGHEAKAQPSSLALQTQAAATSTFAFMAVGLGTTTYQFDSNGAFSATKIPNMQPIDRTSLYIQFAASSSASTLVVTPQWSNNNIDWYGFNTGLSGSPTATGVISLASTSVTYQYTPGAAGTTTTVILLPDVPAQHERVVYSEIGANGSIYSEVDLKKNPSTP